MLMEIKWLVWKWGEQGQKEQTTEGGGMGGGLPLGIKWK